MSDYCNPSDTEELLNWTIAYPVQQSKSDSDNRLDSLDGSKPSKNKLTFDNINRNIAEKSNNKLDSQSDKRLKSVQTLSAKSNNNIKVQNSIGTVVSTSKARNLI